MEDAYIKRIKAIIDRNMTPQGPNFDAEALMWALEKIEVLDPIPVAEEEPIVLPIGYIRDDV